MREKYRVAIIVPVHNEAKSIGKLIEETETRILKRYAQAELFIFEDGSTDGTKKALKKYQKEGASRIHISATASRKGYPRAAKDAILSIDPAAYTHLLFMDGDGQYYMDDIEKLIKLGQEKGYDIVSGMRTNRVEAAYRRILTSGLKVLLAVLFRPKAKDVTSALRLMKVQIAQDIASKVRYSEYNFWLEFTSRMPRQLKMLEIPVKYRKREEGESQIYSPGRIHRIVLAEFSAISKVWLELTFK